MNETLTSRLLPSGMIDMLPEEAEAQTALTQLFLNMFRQYGYRQVKPPLLEAESSLFEGAGKTYAENSFRTLDPASNTMLALRPDMTMQIARMASGVLSQSPRPLRLSYAGQSVRTHSESVDPRRQHQQVGLELFGSLSPEADIEVMSAAISALYKAELGPLTIDISLPNIVNDGLSTISEAERAPALAALEHKDKAALEQLGLVQFAELLSASAPINSWHDVISTYQPTLGEKDVWQHITLCCEALAKRFPELTITIDPLETHGFGYHETISYALFLNDQGKEIGRGGRYTTSSGEAATGLSLYADTILSAYTHATTADIVFVAAELPLDTIHALHNDGDMTVQALEAYDKDTMKTKAAAQGCTHFWNDETQQKEAL